MRSGIIAEAIWMANPVEKERSVMDRVRAGEITLAEIVPVKAAAPERTVGFGQETVEMETPREERAPTRGEGKRAAREEAKPEMEEPPTQEEKPAKRDLAAEKPVKSDEFDVAFEEAGAPVQKSGGKKKKGGDEDFLYLGKGI